MNFGGILAGGQGTRMGKTDLPKQFLMLGEKPIIIHTIEQFLVSPVIDEVIVAVPDNWISYTQDIVDKYCSNNSVHIIQGGSSRNDTIMNVCKYISEKSNDEENIVVTHDAVRPFITQRIIKDNVEECRKYDAVDTVIPATDTIVESKNGEVISNIPIRGEMYQGQTPQSFKVKEFINQYNNLTEEEKQILTDACKVYVLKQKQVGLVKGELYNMKITTKHDLKMAKLMLNNLDNEEV
ncbi:MAG: 2-C-methyl-D-erythritol 4-phosphate cytidylyltransferase [Clostridia bacterium]|nr:2-C-methyl-D-erythritol 4-phosphate cytidylyltransferase [Clostridia bacterium]